MASPESTGDEVFDYHVGYMLEIDDKKSNFTVEVAPKLKRKARILSRLNEVFGDEVLIGEEVTVSYMPGSTIISGNLVDGSGNKLNPNNFEAIKEVVSVGLEMTFSPTDITKTKVHDMPPNP